LGIHADLMEGARIACRIMIELLAGQHGLSPRCTPAAATIVSSPQRVWFTNPKPNRYMSLAFTPGVGRR